MTAERKIAEISAFAGIEKRVEQLTGRDYGKISRALGILGVDKEPSGRITIQHLGMNIFIQDRYRLPEVIPYSVRITSHEKPGSFSCQFENPVVGIHDNYITFTEIQGSKGAAVEQRAVFSRSVFSFSLNPVK